MYLYQKVEGYNARTQAGIQPPFGMGLSPNEVGRVSWIDIWCTNFDDKGPDYCMMVAFDEAGNEVANVRIDGY